MNAIQKLSKACGIRGIASLDVPDYAGMTLNKFINFVSLVENKVGQTEQEFSNSQNFLNLVKDINRAVITGSCVMNHRLDKKIASDDLDIFLDDTVENRTICLEFFKQPLIQTLIQDMYPKVKLGMNDYSDTSFNSNYQMQKQDCLLGTTRFLQYDSKSNPIFNLNFIFVKRMLAEDRAMNGRQESSTNNMHGSLFESSKDDTIFIRHPNMFSNVDEESVKIMDEIFPKAVALNSIEGSFDFEELKYIYSFSDKECLSVYQASINLIEEWSKEIQAIRPGILESAALKGAVDTARESADRVRRLLKDHLDITSNPDVLTISPRCMSKKTFRNITSCSSFLDRGFGVDNLFKPDSGSIGQIRMINECYTVQSNLIQRINKYEPRGYSFVDPECVLLRIQTYIDAWNAKTLHQSTINQIMRESGLLSARETLTAIKEVQTSITDAKEKNKKFSMELSDYKDKDKNSSIINSIEPQGEVCQI